MKSKGKRPLY